MLDHLTFADGLVGLPDLRRFSVRPLTETAFLSLDSLDDPTFGVVAADAEDVRPGIADELARAGAVPPGHRVLVLLAVHGDPPALTANLAGPIVVDPATGEARQVVLEGDSFPLRLPLEAS